MFITRNYVFIITPVLFIMCFSCAYTREQFFYNSHYRNDWPVSFDANFTIDSSVVVGGVSAIWNSTGLSPPDPHQNVCSWLQSESFIRNVALISSIPHSGVRRVRIHWLLDAISLDSSSTAEVPVFNFTCLDKVIHLLHTNGLLPGFEIMGNPGNFISDFMNRSQLEQFANLVHSLALRYIDMFDLDYVAQWYFESWNEPKLKHFDGLNVTIQGFLNYYDAVATSLKKASSRLVVGGPGGACTDYFDLSNYCWALLDHVHNGINCMTGLNDVPFDFISIHKKGEGIRNTEVMLQKEINFISQLKKHLPRLLRKPLFNDEADPQVSWNISRWWQADATYAAMAVKIIVEHEYRLEDFDIEYSLLSNDNAFLSYHPHPFTQRTMLARFQVNSTRPPHVQFIRKPIHAVMGLLSLLGDGRISIYPGAGLSTESLNLLATVHHPAFNNPGDSWQLSVIICNSVDTLNTTGQSTVNLRLLGVPTNSNIMYIVYVVDNKYTNPYKVWKTAGSPPTPSVKLFRRLRQNEEPHRLSSAKQWNATKSNVISLVVKLPGVVLVHLCAKALSAPNQATDLKVTNITCNQVQLGWSDTHVNSMCIMTYEVEFSRLSSKGPFFRINNRDTFFTSFVFDVSSRKRNDDGCYKEQTTGFYRVRPVDYWWRPGKYSNVVQYPCGRRAHVYDAHSCTVY